MLRSIGGGCRRGCGLNYRSSSALRRSAFFTSRLARIVIGCVHSRRLRIFRRTGCRTFERVFAFTRKHIVDARDAPLCLRERLGFAHAACDIVLVACDQVPVDLFFELDHLGREHPTFEQMLDVHTQFVHRSPPFCLSSLSMMRRTRTQRSFASSSSIAPFGVTR